MSGSSSIIYAINAAAKQARGEEAMLGMLRKDFLVQSNNPDGDCGYQLMCVWQKIRQLRQLGSPIPKSVAEERFDPVKILSMRHAIAEMQERSISEGNVTLHELIADCLADWSSSKTHWNCTLP